MLAALAIRRGYVVRRFSLGDDDCHLSDDHSAM
nr:MAG TPA: hypothetical protein [Bacteriophage sp.]